MLDKILSLISTICLLGQVCLSSIIDIDRIKVLIKKNFVNFMLILVIGGTILLSTWLLVLALIFCYLLAMQFTHIQAIAILLVINVVVLFGLLIWLRTTTKKVKIIKKDSRLLLLNNLLILIRDSIQKKC